MFPLRARDKRPAVDRWEKRACADPGIVAQYWPSERHNVGLACGPSGLVVVDLDTTGHGGELPESWRLSGVADGADVLCVLAEHAGALPLPETYTVATPTGGTHLYFRAPEDRDVRNSSGKVGPMIDVRAAGGYVVAAGSVIDGRAYDHPVELARAGRYVALNTAAPALLPGWLAELAAPAPATRQSALWVQRGTGGDAYRRFRGIVATVLGAPDGQRNNALHWGACKAAEMVAAGQVEREAASIALAQAGHVIGLGTAEIERTITSGMRGSA